MFKTVLLCSDGSELAMKAAQRAAFIAKQSDACVLLLNVRDSAGTGDATGETIPYVMPWQLELGMSPNNSALTAEQEEILCRTAKIFEEAKVPCHFLRESGHPAAQIVRLAEHEGVDLIVLGSRGLSVLDALLLGSVSDHVVHHAHCSVLIVR